MEHKVSKEQLSETFSQRVIVINAASGIKARYDVLSQLTRMNLFQGYGIIDFAQFTNGKHMNVLWKELPMLLDRARVLD